MTNINWKQRYAHEAPHLDWQYARHGIIMDGPEHGHLDNVDGLVTHPTPKNDIDLKKHLQEHHGIDYDSELYPVSTQDNLEHTHATDHFINHHENPETTHQHFPNTPIQYTDY